ncbi:MAG: class II fructose-bisphosphate aldolase [Candidatus Hydrogenedens sp.]|nr:class II fructose-bisphosphate aldolase [Candidatus Hydrogenedentota bacterium]NLF58402.1 class II fructose-bisphosphate aldolase [Candidatus Hydrogenedens sp.]
MPVADYAMYVRMLDRALAGGFAYPAINVLELTSLNAAVEGFEAAGSDGIIQISVAAGMHASGPAKDPVLGAITLAEHARRLAERAGVCVAVHTDHCPTGKVDSFLKPLIAETARRRAAGQPNLFQSHMYDGSDLPMRENLRVASELLALCRDNELILEVEAGVVGGEEDGMSAAPNAKLYTTPEDMLLVHETLSPVGGRFMLAATFGNVHGVYKPGSVKLMPGILRDGQAAVTAKYGDAARMWLVFHGGSGTGTEEIHETLDYGVVKMNIHTDTQYALTRAVADHMFTHYAGVLKVDGEVGVKQDYLASTWLDKGRAGMVERVVRACEELRSAGSRV